MLRSHFHLNGEKLPLTFSKYFLHKIKSIKESDISVTLFLRYSCTFLKLVKFSNDRKVQFSVKNDTNRTHKSRISSWAKQLLISVLYAKLEALTFVVYLYMWKPGTQEISYMPRITRSVEMINFIFYNVHSELLDKAVKRYTDQIE